MITRLNIDVNYYCVIYKSNVFYTQFKLHFFSTKYVIYLTALTTSTIFTSNDIPFQHKVYVFNCDCIIISQSNVFYLNFKLHSLLPQSLCLQLYFLWLQCLLPSIQAKFLFNTISSLQLHYLALVSSTFNFSYIPS